MSGKNVFFIGPGFIGREVIDRLVAENYHVTTLVRRESAIPDFQKAGIDTRLGELDNAEVITDQTVKSDIIIHSATADDLPSVLAILEGIKRRAKAGHKTIYIHTSGSGVLDDRCMSASKSEKVYKDDDPDMINTLPDDNPHRNVDLAILKARKEIGAAAKIAILMPPLIYGFNPKYKRHSIQLPTLTRFALKHGYAGHVGAGAAVWNQVHVFDVARAYLVILHWLEKTDAQEVLANPYFFCENGTEMSWRDISAVIGQVLYDAGKIKSSEPKEIPKQDWDDLFGPDSAGVVGSNSRNRANRLRELGWEPKEKRLVEDLREGEIEVILQG